MIEALGNPAAGDTPTLDVAQTLDIHQILKLLPHRYPFLLVDRVTAYAPGKSIEGYKNISMNEPFFQGHFRTGR